MSTQTKLLRVLQENEVVAVGDTRASSIDVRVIAASHAELEAAVSEGRFRRDLHMRLCGITISCGPLRERLEDLGLLMAKLAAQRGKAPPQVDRQAAGALARYLWPGNIRELGQVLATAMELAGGEHIGLKHLPDRLQGLEKTADEVVLRATLEGALRRHRGNVSAVARELGKARVQIRRWCERFRIDIDAFRGS